MQIRKRLPRVALLIESSRTYGREILRGINRYTREHGAWAFYTMERELHSGVPEWLRHWQGDGIIARIEDRAMARKLSQIGCAVVDVLGTARFRSIPGLDTDAERVARMAADFFLKAGFRHFAFRGFEGVPFSDRRGAAFVEYLQTLHFVVQVFKSPSACHQPAHIQAVEQRGLSHEAAGARWLKKLPRPLALFACNDICAQQVLNSCREHNIRVPEEVSVIGVDNDDVICELCDPPLSSIEPDAKQIGYEAATLLDRMMKGLEVSFITKRLQLVRLVERASTDTVAVGDPVTVSALRYIRNHFAEGIAVKDMVAQMECSRTNLERRFHQTLHCSIRDVILQRRMHHARGLLSESNLRLKDIAARAGFSTAAHFCRIFQKEFKQSPTQYRSRVK